MAFPPPGRSAEQHVFMALDESAGSQVDDEGAIHPWSGRKVEMRQGLGRVAAGSGQAVSQAVLLAAFQLIIQQKGKKLHGSQLLLDGLLHTQVQGVKHAGKVELPELGQ